MADDMQGAARSGEGRVASMRPRRMMSRRGFFQMMGGIAAAGAGTGSYAYAVEAHRLVLEQVELPLPGLAKRWEGQLIVQLTDLHVNGADSPRLLSRAVAMAVGCKPAMIMVTGDWVNDSLEHVEDIRQALAQVPKDVEVVGILGNHDYGYQKHWGAIDDDLCEILRGLGVRVLRNELWQPFAGAGELCIAGLEDYWCHRFRPQVLARAPRDAAVLVLSHNPDSYDDMAEYRWDAVLCGHTHGGQVRIPGYGAIKVPVAHTEWAAGMFTPDGPGTRRLMYVSRGVGHWFRVRLFCPPEVTCFTLRRA